MANKQKIQFNRQIMQLCPVCGIKKKLTVHHILPQFIFKEIKTDERAFFLNGENSYWLCSKCHSNYETRYADKLRIKLMLETKFSEDYLFVTYKEPNLTKIKNLCRYMTGKYNTNNYNYSIYQSYEFVKNFYKKKYLQYNEILKLSVLNEYVPNPNYINLGEFLLEKIGSQQLDKIFRQNFNEYLLHKKLNESYLIEEKNKYYEI